MLRDDLNNDREGVHYNDTVVTNVSCKSDVDDGFSDDADDVNFNDDDYGDDDVSESNDGYDDDDVNGNHNDFEHENYNV